MNYLNYLYAYSLFILLGITETIHAQQFEWVKAIKTTKTGSGFGEGITIDQDGNTYTVGRFRSEFDFDPGPGELLKATTSNIDTDGYVLKQDSAGELVWMFPVSSSGEDQVLDVKIHENGDLFVTGSLSDSTTFGSISDTVVYTNGAQYGFVLRISPDAEFKKLLVFAGQDVVCRKVNFGLTDEIYITGNVRGFLDLNPSEALDTLTTVGDINSFIVQLDNANEYEYQWGRTIDTTDQLIIYDLAVQENGDLVACGTFDGETDFDLGNGQSIQESKGFDGFIMSLDYQGEFKWVNVLSGIGTQSIRALEVINSNEVVVVGSADKWLEYNNANGALEIIETDTGALFVAKLKMEGDVDWVRLALGHRSWGFDLAVDQRSNIYATGTSKGKLYISRLTTSGDIDREYLLGDGIESNARQIFISDDGLIGITGYFQGTIDFDPGVAVSNESYKSAYDIFIQRFNHCQFAAKIGYDTNDSSILRSDVLGQRYQWLNCATGFTTSFSDTMDFHNPIMPGPYQLRIEDGFCTDTSNCIDFKMVGLDELDIDEVHIALFPNPIARGASLNLDIPLGAANGVFKVMNISGAVIQSGLIKNDRFTISTNSLHAGLYLVELEFESESEIKIAREKFIVN